MRQKICKPDYKNCLVNLSNSILKHYGLPLKHPSLPQLDAILEAKQYNSVIVLQMDGMGMDMLEQNLPEDSFLRSNIRQTITSVFPPTTTAATTSTNSGQTPIEHAHISWQCYFEEYDSHVVLFRNHDFYTETKLPINVTQKHLNYEPLYEQISNAGKTKAFGVSKFWGDFQHINSFTEVCNTIADLASNHEQKFIASYWDQPDDCMHKTGCYSPKTKKTIKHLNAKIEKLAGKLKNAVLIITADHGQLNIAQSIALNKIPELNDCLRLAPGCEARAIAFYVKPEKYDLFPALFNKHFGDEFILLKSEDFIKQNYLGEGKEHLLSKGFLGDYMALAIGESIIQYQTKGGLEPKNYIGHHGGLSEKEMLIPLIVYEC